MPERVGTPVYASGLRPPALALRFPRHLTTLHQIEITSRCSLKCVYCPSILITAGKQPHRPAVDMERRVFERALDHVRHYVARGSQCELNLAGIGESTLHPEFSEFVRLARAAVGDQVILIFATNGVDCTEELVSSIAPYRPQVWVSLHRPERAARAVDLYRRAGLLCGVSTHPATDGMDWAGQVRWTRPDGYREACMWLRDGRAMVMADGRVTTCCLDAQGTDGVVGHVDDAIGSFRVQPYSLCQPCYQEVAVRGWDQKAGRWATATA